MDSFQILGFAIIKIKMNFNLKLVLLKIQNTSMVKPNTYVNKSSKIIKNNH
ncbi:hypothetical protein BGP_3037 [Beggiatoa sp. PS]|nr:hypothetical protein BGP_3037 [Beggiatoa sp. PS]